MKPSLVVFLHGVGATGASLAPLGSRWATRLPGTAFESPDGPEPFSGGGNGRQWFSIAGVTAENRPERVEAARETFDVLLAALMARHGVQPEQTALVGFSQGAIMALDALGSGRWSFAAVVAMAGRLASPEPLSPARATPLLILHGDADRVMPIAEAQTAEARLSALGVRVTSRVLHGAEHMVTFEGADAAEAFLRRHLPQ